MPIEALYGGICTSRYYDYPRPGSIYTMSDDPRLQRGPTIVKLHNGKDMVVPANFKQDMKSDAQSHDMGDNKQALQQMLAMMTGKKMPQGPEAQKGFGMQMPGFAGREQQLPRDAGVPMGGGMHGAF